MIDSCVTVNLTAYDDVSRVHYVDGVYDTLLYAVLHIASKRLNYSVQGGWFYKNTK